jgi:hypothetical protein
MNEFISPHQNININISYNLGQHERPARAALGRRLGRAGKHSCKECPETVVKTLKKPNDAPSRPEETRKEKHLKSNKVKKKGSPADHEPMIGRRLKTEGNRKS